MHVAQARAAHGERDGQQHDLVVVATQAGELAGDVDVGGIHHAGLVELAQQSRGVQHKARRERVALAGGHGLGRRPLHARVADRHRPSVGGSGSSASLSAGTRPGGAGHPKTPVRDPWPSGWSAPVIPRTNR